jgi:alkyl hydroperoxide reductase subunit AhpC
MAQSEIDRELNKLKVTTIQKKLIADMGQALARVLDMPTPTMRGFYAIAVITWQQKINKTAAETESGRSTTTAARMQSAKEILAIMRERVLDVVRLHNKEHLLDQAIEAAIKLYTEKYASRPPDVE